MPRVMIGCPVRNRGWVLPRYLQHLTGLDYPAGEVEYCFVINDCHDDTEALLGRFARQYPVRLLYNNSSQPGGWRRGFYNFGRLACLRNLLLQAFLESNCDYLFSVDSDILVPPHCLAQLVQDQVDMVSALVCNGEEIGDKECFNVLRWEGSQLLPIRNVCRSVMFPVDCTGAACLISRSVAEAGARYNDHWGPEDIGFCWQVQKQGFSIFCDGRIECLHIMQETHKNSDNR